MTVLSAVWFLWTWRFRRDLKRAVERACPSCGERNGWHDFGCVDADGD
jgi:hypothetical protein